MRVFGYARHLSCTTALFFPSFLAVVRDIPQTRPRLERLCHTMFLVFLSRRIGWSACVDLEGTGFSYGCVPMARWSHPVETPTKSFLLYVSTDNVTVALRFFLAMFKSSPCKPELTSQISSIVRAWVATSRAYCALSTGVWHSQFLSPPSSAERWRGHLESRTGPTCIYSL